MAESNLKRSSSVLGYEKVMTKKIRNSKHPVKVPLSNMEVEVLVEDLSDESPEEDVTEDIIDYITIKPQDELNEPTYSENITENATLTLLVDKVDPPAQKVLNVENILHDSSKVSIKNKSFGNSKYTKHKTDNNEDVHVSVTIESDDELMNNQNATLTLLDESNGDNIPLDEDDTHLATITLTSDECSDELTYEEDSVCDDEDTHSSDGDDNQDVNQPQAEKNSDCNNEPLIMEKYEADPDLILELVNEFLPTIVLEYSMKIELKNSWGNVRNHEHIPTQDDILIQNALYKWSKWQTMNANRHAPLMFKCYVCNVAWWHLGEFQNHIRKHIKHLKVDIETINHVCYLIAYVGTQPDIRTIHLGGRCPVCAQDSDFHDLQQPNGINYKCNTCRQGFVSCFNFFQHRGPCYTNKRICKWSCQGKTNFNCNICNITIRSHVLQRHHYRLFHDVRSDLPISEPMKFCVHCSSSYEWTEVHDCLKKPIYYCNYCCKRFLSKALLQAHKSNVSCQTSCKICSYNLKSQCCKTMHLVEHSKYFVKRFKCMLCSGYTLYTNELNIRRHWDAMHKKYQSEAMMQIVIVPKYFEKIIMRLGVGQRKEENNKDTKAESDEYDQNTFEGTEHKLELSEEKEDDQDLGKLLEEEIANDLKEMEETFLDKFQIPNEITTDVVIKKEDDDDDDDLVIDTGNDGDEEADVIVVLSDSDDEMDSKAKYYRNNHEIEIKVEMDYKEDLSIVKNECSEEDDVPVNELPNISGYVKQELIQTDNSSDEIDNIAFIQNIKIENEEFECTDTSISIKTDGDLSGSRLDALSSDIVYDHSISKYVTKSSMLLYRKHPKRKEIVCILCGFKSRLRHYKKHVEHCLQPYKCTKCSCVFETIPEYVKHYRIHNYKLNECPHCHSGFVGPKHLGMHVAELVRTSFSLLETTEALGNVRHQCRTCYMNVRMKDLFQHWEAHLSLTKKDNDTNEEDNDSETEAGKGKPSEDYMLSKIKSLLVSKFKPEKGGFGVKCVQCTKWFTRTHTYKRHLIEHLLMASKYDESKNRGLKCQICTKILGDPQIFRYHMRCHGKMRLYKCRLCPKEFSDSSNYAKHVKVHTTTAFSCKICKKKFITDSNRIIHEEKHQLSKIITCECCDKSFYFLNAFKRHVTVRKKKTDRQSCNFCSEFFDNNYDRSVHAWRIHAIKLRHRSTRNMELPTKKIES